METLSGTRREEAGRGETRGERSAPGSGKWGRNTKLDSIVPQRKWIRQKVFAEGTYLQKFFNFRESRCRDERGTVLCEPKLRFLFCVSRIRRASVADRIHLLHRRGNCKISSFIHERKQSQDVSDGGPVDAEKNISERTRGVHTSLSLSLSLLRRERE